MPFIKRTSTRLAIGLFAVLFLTSPTFGQGLAGIQIFAPADVSTYGGPIPPNEGYFLQYDVLYWSFSAPKTQLIGAPGLTRDVAYGPEPEDVRTETSTLTTGDLTNNFSIGSRFDFGYIQDRHGWFMSINQLNQQEQFMNYGSADIIFKDPPVQGTTGATLLSGPVSVSPTVVADLPVTLYNLTVMNQTSTWGVEANYLFRAMTHHTGGTLEFFGGCRYLEFNDMFGVNTGSANSTPTIPDFLSNSSWYTTADNHIIGPQVGVRWFKKQGRWTLSSEGRFLAGLNCQNIHQDSVIGPNLNPSGSTSLFTPSLMGPTSATDDAYTREFTPLIELRIEGRYQITRNLSFHAGWTGFWMDNIARANGLVNYSVYNETGPAAMGINMANNKQNVFVNGLTIGFDINR